MKVYAALLGRDYEGSELLAVFSSLEKANQFITEEGISYKKHSHGNDPVVKNREDGTLELRVMDVIYYIQIEDLK